MGFRGWGLGFRVRGLGFKIQGFWVRVFAACMAIQHRKVESRVRLKHPVTETPKGLGFYGLR